MQRHGNRWRGAETRFGIERWCNGWSSTHVWWIKIVRDTLGAKDPSLRPDHTAQGSSARKIDPYIFWL